MPDCNRCGSFVSSDFVRVFGNNDGHAFGCPDCMPSTKLIEGHAAQS